MWHGMMRATDGSGRSDTASVRLPFLLLLLLLLDEEVRMDSRLTETLIFVETTVQEGLRR
jgi:hypothetical protein